MRSPWVGGKGSFMEMMVTAGNIDMEIRNLIVKGKKF